MNRSDSRIAVNLSDGFGDVDTADEYFSRARSLYECDLGLNSLFWKRGQAEYDALRNEVVHEGGM